MSCSPIWEQCISQLLEGFSFDLFEYRVRGFTLHDWLKKNSRHFFIQTEPNLIATRSQTFSRASRQLRVFTTSFDWFIGLPESFMIGMSDY